VALVALLILLAGGWLWFRDSSLVSVDRVTVSGAAGMDSAQIQSALVTAARRMTTLDVNLGRLRSAVAGYPVVADLRVSSQFPHGIRIRVIERVPVAVLLVGGRTMAVSADGMLLHDVSGAAALPSITTRLPAGGGRRVTQPQVLGEAALLGAAPGQLIPKISQVTTDPTHGLAAQLRGGPVIYFGDAGELASKWIAVSAVLADPGSSGASYIDVTDPQRPAAGTGGSASGSSSTSTASTGAASTTGAVAPTSAGTPVSPATAGAATGAASTTGG
jgi:cell division protein FtsQ